MNNFLKPGLQDLCVSRTTFTWSIPVSYTHLKRVYIIIGIAIAIIGAVIFFMFMDRPVVEFKDDIGKIEIKGEYDPKSFISQVRGHDIDDIDVDKSQVNIEKIGTYELIYKLNDKEYILKVEVVDTVAPTFEVNSLDIDLGRNVSVEDIVKNINDQTETKSYFKETYDFSKEGEQDVYKRQEQWNIQRLFQQVLVNLLQFNILHHMQGVQWQKSGYHKEKMF